MMRSRASRLIPALERQMKVESLKLKKQKQKQNSMINRNGSRRDTKVGGNFYSCRMRQRWQRE